ncbi:DMT family transporter [Jhaorihella thermophila]|uniref:Permease of the drug/metabolite transporter (DMT) superfamily n=1 Tax=Jhaorihella thermophila TaxID=488547 RepID=A0A1H5WV74_9RHOB|nr:DMT family transporter [Jhaorihella thermophila]SEG03140.1 Permease of the drug/metabolite transporter (DMT) superfamily [Jhaorihella thermophila]
MENLRGALLMTLSMLGFAFEDMFIKLLAGRLPTWEILAALGAGGAAVFGATLALRGERLVSRAMLSRRILLRNVGEVIGTLGFVTAIALTPISQASAILQATPLAVTLGAALFLGEPVGWRRWSAICAGFLGVLLVIRPGLEGFDARSIFAVIGVIGLAIRDLVTRNVPKGISSFQLSFLGFLTLVPASGLLALVTGAPAVAPRVADLGLLAGAVGLGTLSYYAIVAAMRVGEVSFVTPFRYSRLLFALVVGMAVFEERPDAPMLLGAAVIVGSGIYTIWRERKHRRATPAPLSLAPEPR